MHKINILCYIFIIFCDLKYNYACCPNACSGHGICTTVGSGCICKCFTGYWGGDCSRRECPSGSAWGHVASITDVAHDPIECSNRGACDFETGKCICDPGFTGLACQRMACPDDCNHHGVCRSMKSQARHKDKGSGPPVVYDQVWDSEMIYGCVCDDGYSGSDCSMRKCPTGDDPLTGFDSDKVFGSQHNEKQILYCSATGGSFTLSFQGQTTVPINAIDHADVVSTKINALRTIGNVNVLYGGLQTEVCHPDGTYVVIEFTQDFGPQTLLVADITKLEHLGLVGTPEVRISLSEQGTKENEVCSNRGICDEVTGVCQCFSGFTTSNGHRELGTRGDCGSTKSPITSCPIGLTYHGELPCSGHGYCTGAPFYRCQCMSGWTAGDCSLRLCPMGTAWFDTAISDNIAHRYAECSGVGKCNRKTGECECSPLFEGGSCERMSCPGEKLPCSGNGRCLTLAKAAMEADINGDPAPDVSYGQIKNDPRTWDAHKIQICLCDKKYEGHDCSRRSCPKGDNPRTSGQSHKIQTIMCQHQELTGFTLSFRGSTTRPLLSTSSAMALQEALAELPTIALYPIEAKVPQLARSPILVTYTNGNSACTTDGSNIISVVFADLFGDLPAIKMSPDIDNPSLLTVITVNAGGKGTSVIGLKEFVECSYNGICDYGNGICSCFEGMASSNGHGDAGIRMDCGYIIKMFAPEK